MHSTWRNLSEAGCNAVRGHWPLGDKNESCVCLWVWPGAPCVFVEPCVVLPFAYRRKENIDSRIKARQDRRKASREKKLLRAGFEGRKQGFIATPKAS